MKLLLPYGMGTITFSLPRGLQPDILRYREEPLEPSTDPVAAALASPIGSPHLAELAAGKRSAVILISDISRLCPSHLFLERLLDELNEGGIDDSQITVVVALGLHRKQAEGELKKLAGDSAFKRVRVINHSAHGPDCIRVGITARGTPVEINRHVVEAELRIATGNIEPHRLAGMSGGVKALVPGCPSQACIEHNHALSQTFRAIPGQTEDNPVRDDMEEALSFVPIHFLLNVVANHRRELLAAAAGDVLQAHHAGMLAAKRHFFIAPPQDAYDLVIASAGGWPKDSQLYQAVKTLQNAADFTRPGGSILLAARCQEGFGNGIFQYWAETLQDRKTITNLLKQKFVLGAHKLAHIDEILQKHEVYMVTDMPAPQAELLGFRPVADPEELLRQLASQAGAEEDMRIAVLPYGGLTFRDKGDLK